MQNSAQTSNYQANQDELVALYSGPEADCLQAWREKRPQAGAVQDGRPFVCAGRWALLRKQGWLPPDTYPNLCDWIPGSPGGSPLKACLYLPFFFLHIPPSPMKCESSGAWTSWTTHPCFPLLIPAIRELWSFPSLCISTLLPTLRPGQPGWPTLCSSLGKVSAPLWGGSPATGVHLSDPLIGTGLSLSACNVGGLGSIPGLGRSPGEGNGYPLQYSGLENSMDCIVHGASKSWTRLSDPHFHFSLINGKFKDKM